ncbi:MAG: DUF2505 family protein [Polyangiaceae bacterium]|jgi:hypothetical protein|nr:DUF2505 family protein [Polyangiaceae bacterium]MBK8941762.1 DUF2505 family protein [Polyangiaceae bacterium]
MQNVKISHEINCSEEKFWELFFDKEFNTKLYLEGLEFPEWKIEEQTDNDVEVKRRTKGRPKLKNVPGPVAKILGDSFGYVETGSMTKKEKVWRWKLTPSTLADKIRQEGQLRIEVLGDNKVRRNVEMVIEAKVFGLGGILESTAEKQLRDGWEDSAKFMNKWIEAHK